ncbi:DNA sulfur modification protein DndB [Leptolyngbya sp. PCC 6406]|uniref:DNA sulfur modification protein DndB n=1 Tax=Leptolyngbya sp. PCC 6406 TaxID=1173264 RepID=UPI0002AC25C7|nr:DNA sulfur modification protein DndB [Leptolyngbya sp. PCC 6406]
MADYVPALKARMGDWQYYVTVMKLGKIAKECQLAEEIHAHKDLDEVIQREISNRVSKEMVPYLLNEPQRFYGALVVAVYGGEPEFSPVKVAEHDLLNDLDDDKHSYGFGLLRFDGSQVYYALDGQHRLRSIQEAIAMDPDLRQEEITVIILNHENTKEGLQRTRRLFSTLNRRAKPTSSGVNIAIDEDDAIAIVTRRLVKESSVLKNLVLCKLGSKQITPSKGNDPYITTLSAFYETNEILIAIPAYKMGRDIDGSFKQFRPSNEDLDEYYGFLEQVWMQLLGKAPGFDQVLKGKKTPGDLRKKTDSDGKMIIDDAGNPLPGGSIFARPMGQYILAEVLMLAGIQDKSIPETIGAIMENISMDIDDSPWANLIWNPGTRRIVGGKTERKLISSIISHSLGLKIKDKVRDLKQKYRDQIGNPKAALLKPIEWAGNTRSMADMEGEYGDE